MPGGTGIEESTPTLSGLGQIEYRLARDAAVRNFRRGRLSRLDVCDAQPELLRVAKNLGQPTSTLCPICDEPPALVNVFFAFGPRLPPAGRALESQTELRALARSDDISFYVVEVCTECGWNHLLRMFTAAQARRRPRVRRT